MSTNAERLKKYRAKMRAAGFERMSFYGCPELVKLLRHERRAHVECYGRTLERLLLGQAAKRPDYWTTEEQAQRERRKARIMRMPDFMPPP